MRVLHLPSNIASILSHQVRAELQAGMDAMGLVLGAQSPITSTVGVQTLPLPRRRNVTGWIRLIGRLRQAMASADMVHWYFGRSIAPFGLDLRSLAHAERPGVVEFLGSDIRNPDIERLDNPYYAECYGKGYEYAVEESATRSVATQQAFLKAGFVPVVPNGMIQYLIPAAREIARVIERGVLLEDYQVDIGGCREVPVVAHAPSAPVAKGTASIESALESLKGDVRFEYVRVHGVPRAEALRALACADIVVDQVVLGDYGMAAIEAMALGKPVVAWIKPAIRALYPEDLPIVDAEPARLADVIHGLLVDPELRKAIGMRSRSFVERYHNARLRALEMRKLYEELV